VIKAIVFAALAACGVSPTPAAEPPAEQPGEFEPGGVKPVDQHWCCASVDFKTLSGDGCWTIGAGQIDQCPKVLYCPGAWVKDEGKVQCVKD
jgi:hypothetical protein